MSEPAKPPSIKIYTASYCGFCHRAKQLLRDRQLAFEEVDVTDDDDTRDWLAGETGRHTVPQIFIEGRPIGGYDDLAALDRSGRLADLVAPKA